MIFGPAPAPERAVECPVCGVPAGRACKTTSGHGRVTVHAARSRAAGIDPTMPKGRFACACGSVYVYENALWRHQHGRYGGNNICPDAQRSPGVIFGGEPA